MTVYAVGGEADTFYPVSGQAFAFEATGGRFVSTASRGAMKVTQAVSEIELNLPSNQTEVWIHMYLYQEAVAGAVDDWIQIKNLAGSNNFRIGLNADGSWDADMYQGASWGNLDSSAGSVISSGAAEIDIYIRIHASTGEFRVFKDGVEIITFTGDTSGDNPNVGRIHWKGQTGGANELNVSQVIVASESTVGWKLCTLHPTGNSATNTGWTGSYTDIDEFVLDTGDYIEAISTNLVETSTLADLDAAYSTYNVKAVAVGVRASNDSGSAVADIQAAIRTNSTNFFSSDLSLPKDGADYSRQAIWDQNPDTTAAWTQSAVNNLEAGVKSV